VCREGVEKDSAITQLQIEITELNNEMDDLKEENYANLSVINRLKASKLLLTRKYLFLRRFKGLKRNFRSLRRLPTRKDKLCFSFPIEVCEKINEENCSIFSLIVN
jgi:hypothetical protein